MSANSQKQTLDHWMAAESIGGAVAGIHPFVLRHRREEADRDGALQVDHDAALKSRLSGRALSDFVFRIKVYE